MSLQLEQENTPYMKLTERGGPRIKTMGDRENDEEVAMVLQ